MKLQIAREQAAEERVLDLLLPPASTADARNSGCGCRGTAGSESAFARKIPRPTARRKT